MNDTEEQLIAKEHVAGSDIDYYYKVSTNKYFNRVSTTQTIKVLGQNKKTAWGRIFMVDGLSDLDSIRERVKKTAESLQ